MMSQKSILQLIIAVFITALIGIIFYYREGLLPQKTQTDSPPVERKKIEQPKTSGEEMSTDRVSEIEKDIETLQEKLDDQEIAYKELEKKQSVVATPEATLDSQNILGTVQAQGGSFSTSATSYSPMGIFVNISCPKACKLWINFYTSSKNSTANNVNTYGVFVNGADKGIYSQAAMPVANSAQSISLNNVQSVNAGTHTVEIQAKTSGGTLQSDISYLQVLAIEQ